jgi:hypothetical protein
LDVAAGERNTMMFRYVLLALAGALSAFAAESISDSDRAYLVAHLEMTREFVLDATRNLSTQQWLHHSDARHWSIAQCIDHLARSEAFVLLLIRDRVMHSDEPFTGAFPSTAKGRARVSEAPKRMSNVEDGIVIRWMTDRTGALTIPVEKRPPIEEVAPRVAFDDPRSALAGFLTARAAMIDYVKNTRDDLRGHITVSPMEGFPQMKFTDGYQWLLRMSAHTERHLMQIQEVRRSKGYPGVPE